ncbi:D-alanyl-D-alanine carboxypeptidase [Streptomyces sp. ME02-6991-2B]|nr:D-alanyl-D-alanine carboxypeptidase [Streptomyces sp. ME02-6991-2B]
MDGGVQDATPDAAVAPAVDDAVGGAQSRTDDAVAEEADAARSATDGAEDGDGGGAGEEPVAGGTPAEEPGVEDAVEPRERREHAGLARGAGSAATGSGPMESSAVAETAGGEEPSAGTDAEAPSGEVPARGTHAEARSGDAPVQGTDARTAGEAPKSAPGVAPENASQEGPEDAPGKAENVAGDAGDDPATESRDDTPSGRPGGEDTEGPAQGPGGVKGGPGAHEASGGGQQGPGSGEGTLALRAPRTEDGATPVRDRTPAVRASAASAPVRTPPRPGGTFVPLRTDERPAPTPSAPAPAQAPRIPQAAEPGGASRTKQMPLPPDPDEPLRLLAELTNTPPPPQTPLRTTVRRLKIWTPLVLLLAVLFCLAQALRPLPEPRLRATAETTYTFEGDELALPWPSEGQAVVEAEGLGRVGEFGEQKPTPIASVAKVMTTYVILRDHPIKKGGKGETVKVDQKAEDQYHSGLQESESVVPVTAGQKLSEYEALEAVMLPSANNIARLLARWDAGSEEAFVRKMNAAARELGMQDTTYTDPSGLEATTVSTASDQVKLGHAAMKNPVFAEIATMTRYTDVNGGVQQNYNQLAGYNNIVGIKTGTSTKAGGNLLFAAYRTIGGTRQLIIGAMLDQQKAPIIDTVLGRSRTLINGTRDALTSATIIKKGEVVGYVDDGLGGRTPVAAGKDVTAVGWAGLQVDVSVETAEGGLPHTAKAGDRVGTLVVGSGDSAIRVPVVLGSALVEPSLGSKLTRIS